MSRVQEEIYKIVEQMGGYATGRIIQERCKANVQTINRNLRMMSESGIIDRRLPVPEGLPSRINPYFYSVKAE